MAYSTVGTYFYYYTDASPAVPTQIYGMMSKPQLPGLPNKVDASSQEDLYQKQASGQIQVLDANFQFKHAPYSETASNFQQFQTLQKKSTPTKFGIAYPDGGAIEFLGKPFVQRDATGVNALDTFTVAMLDVDDIDVEATIPSDIVRSPYDLDNN